MSNTINGLKPNRNKELSIKVGVKSFTRFPVKTHVITDKDNIIGVIKKYCQPYLGKDDLIFISEKIVAISQGRAFPIKDIKPSKLAKFLVRFVHKSPYGIGLGSPWTMELAIKEAGASRIIFAAIISAITKPFGAKGVFYKVVGKNINAIDGPCSYTLPPYNKYAKLGPRKPNDVARTIKKEIGVDAVIIDANDLGVSILGRSNSNISDEFCKNVFRDNPLGQSTEQTPIAIVRKV